jgi:predicted metal-dependent hydrolase
MDCWVFMLHSVENIENLHERIAVGVDFFNREYFFEAHDAFEELWMEAREQTQRDLFHGLVNIATGFYHYRMDNRKGMQSQLQKGVEKLSPVPSHCFGVNLAKLLKHVQPYIQKEYHLNAFPEPLPKIEFNTEEVIRSIS